MGIPLETSQKQYTVYYKLETYLKIAHLYLEDNDPAQAEFFITGAFLLHAETNSEEFLNRFWMRSAKHEFWTIVASLLKLLNVILSVEPKRSLLMKNKIKTGTFWQKTRLAGRILLYIYTTSIAYSSICS